jgi:peptidase A4-like protein
VSTERSYNWCGARVKNQANPSPQKMFIKVEAKWTVPPFVNPPNNETHYAAIFVGLDGGSELLSQNLLQAGVAQILSTDAARTTTQDCHAWYLWDAVGDKWDPNYSTNKVPGFAVSPWGHRYCYIGIQGPWESGSNVLARSRGSYF